MNLVSQYADCPACGTNTGDRTTKKACTCKCTRLSANQFINSTAFADSPTPHLHVTCKVCGFVWLTTVSDPQLFKKMW